jgi:cytochrome c-type biogenesis protein CcmH
MTAFVVVAAAMVAVAVAWVLVPLLRRRERASPDAGTANLGVLRDQRAELNADLARGTLTRERYEQATLELERRVLDEVEPGPPAGSAAPPAASAWTAAILGATIPIAAIALYLVVGAPGALLAESPGASGPQHEVTRDQLEAMVAKLAAHVAKNPDDVKGWALLARSYYVMARYPEAVRAYEQAVALVPRDADLLADYADALGMTQEQRLQGRPLELVQRALEIDPDHWKALALAGTAAFDRKDYGQAIAYWERMRRVVPADSQIGRSIEASIAEARELAGARPAAAAPKTAAPVPGAKVAGRVSLAPALAAKAAPSDTVFIFARAASGPPMPLAVLRKQVKDLPLEFALDDSMAMAPNLKLSGFAEVIVGARVSRSGNATPQSGDLQGVSRPVKVGAAGVAVVIDTAVP